MFIEDGIKDCCDDMASVKLKDGIFDDTDEMNDWGSKEKEEYSFCVGRKEQISLATKSIKILADLRK